MLAFTRAGNMFVEHMNARSAIFGCRSTSSSAANADFRLAIAVVGIGFDGRAKWQEAGSLGSMP